MMLSERGCVDLDPAPKSSSKLQSSFLGVMADGQVKYCLSFPSLILKLMLTDALV